MPRVNFAKVDDAESFAPIPPGRYRAEITSIEESDTRAGDPLWRMKLKVLGGPHDGRLVFDNLVFSAAALKRVKLVCSALGIDTSGEIDLVPEMLIGKACTIHVEVEEYTDNEGRARKRNTIPFAGYEQDAPAAPTEVEEFSPESLPF